MLSGQMTKVCSLITEDGKHIQLKYFITRKFYLHKNQKILYGIAIEQSSEGLPTERECVENLTFELNEAYEIIKIMSDNTVTPTTMLDVLDDMPTYKTPKQSNIA